MMLVLYYATRFRKTGTGTRMKWTVHITRLGLTKTDHDGNTALQAVDLEVKNISRLPALGVDSRKGTKSGIAGVLPW